MSTHCGGESDMEKKNRRQSSVPSSANADNKKDNAGGGGYKGGYRREGSNARPDAQPARRPASQRYRQADKRPRARGASNEYPRNDVAQDERVERGSALLQGSRKANLNHLLNFTFTPRDGGPRRAHVYGGGAAGRTARPFVRRTSKYNKEQFLQANCQFVVRENADYTVHAADPDMLVQWHLIEQVRILSHTPTCCPICLYPPIAAKMTHCGHVYCWPCILHYLSLSEKTWRKCPICYDAVYQDDLKSVDVLEVHRYEPGEAITMKLMKRSRGAMTAFPKTQWALSDRHLNVGDAVDTCYSKLLTVTPRQVLWVVGAEEAALEALLSEQAPQSLEASFTQAAAELVKKRRRNLLSDLAVLEAATLGLHELTVSQTTRTARVTSQPGVSDAPTRQAQTMIEYTCAFMDERVASGEVVLRESGEGEEEEEEEEEAAADVLLEDALDCNNDDATSCSAMEVHERSSDVLPGDEVPGDVLPGEEVPGDVLPGDEVLGDVFPGDEVLGDVLPSDEVPGDVLSGNELPAAVLMMRMTSEMLPDAYSPRATDGASASDEYYFYQAADGQHIYLHSLNARCLTAQYGSLQHSPDTITAVIVQTDALSMTEELRRRLRYMNHLPLTCQFQVVELHLRPPLLSDETLLAFKGKFDWRRQQRDERSRDDRRHSRRIEEEENRKMGKYPSMRMRLSSQQHFPQYSVGDGVTEDAAGAPPQTTPASSAPTPVGSPTGSDQQSTSWKQSDNVSFAQMLRGGGGRDGRAWPSGSRPARRPAHSDESDGEDRQPPPAFHDSFGDAIQKALDSYDNTAVKSPSEGKKGKKNKKKVPKKLLFATTMARSK